ncbi:DUF5059 domain-containing protein [Halopiger xanaduensis]|uniref:Blue (Type 1) copper domain protein n=1 Tax=Halopiger xanaduensis (strain DSM 18323 / JCM 14033 / SH-6) TaxID=797210 RepID=F8D477_HALXS|nr:DUF5059 domain-containing protein [Halopiger xanaduensis]AEH37477.1 blue (type 1) copper domain protein [Halopiger xanaduensis SH-6]
MTTRRKLLALSAAVAGTAVAGCTGGSDGTGTNDSDSSDGDSNGSDASSSEQDETTAVGPELGVAAEWNAIRARVADALALGIAEEFAAGGTVVGDTLTRFESATAEWGAHEQLEGTDHELYEEFEEAVEELRLEGLDEADLERVREEAAIADERLQAAQRERLEGANALALEMALFGARVADVDVLATAGHFGAAETLAEETAERWESATVHDELSGTNGDLYAAFEGELPTLAEAASDENGEGVASAVDAALTAAADAAYELAADDAAAHAAQLATVQARGWDAAVLSDLEGVDSETAADVMRDTFGRFESARSHEALEEADHDAYEAFEGELEAYIEALAAGEGVDEAAGNFAAAALRAQFAVTGALEEAPGDGGDHGHGHEDGHGHREGLEGGPNVVDAVPEDADRVIEIHAASFEPDELTVEAGATVAFEHVEGEPHTVTAYEDAIPGDATYWASGGFDSESAAREGWENGRGAITEGQAYVRTFEVAGTHEFCCIPHETGGQTGRIVVE